MKKLTFILVVAIAANMFVSCYQKHERILEERKINVDNQEIQIKHRLEYFTTDHPELWGICDGKCVSSFLKEFEIPIKEIPEEIISGYSYRISTPIKVKDHIEIYYRPAFNNENWKMLISFNI